MPTSSWRAWIGDGLTGPTDPGLGSLGQFLEKSNNFLNVLPYLSPNRDGIVAKDIGGMVGGHHRGSLVGLPVSSELTHRLLRVQEGLGGWPSQGYDDLRFDRGNLLL